MIWSKRRLRERLVMALFEQAKTPGTQMSVDELIFAAAFLERFILNGSAPTPQSALKNLLAPKPDLVGVVSKEIQ